MIRLRECPLQFLVRAERARRPGRVFYHNGAFYDVLRVNWRAGYVDLEPTC